MTKQHIPKIRFQGFDDEWEEETLSNIAEIVGGGTPSTKVGKYWNGEINWFSPTEIGNTIYVNNSIKKITELGLKNSSARLLPANRTILFTSRAGIGDAAILISDATTNQGFQSLVLNDDKNIYFIYSQKDKIKHYALKHSAGSTFLEISGKELRKMKISLPTLPEQESIGQLFRTLDDLISAYKENLEHYQSLKTSMLSKMFPKEGQKQPEIRLDGFEGDWESSILKNLASFSKGNGYTKSDLTDNGQEIILYGQLYTDYKIQIFCSNYFVSKINNNAILSVGGEVIVPASGESADDISRASVISNPNIVIGGDLNIIYPNNNILDSVFLALMISNGSQQKELKRRAQGKSVVHLRNNDLKEVKIFLPSLPEQEAIGAFFANLDETISSYKDKIGQLELLKKNLLSQMFI